MSFKSFLARLLSGREGDTIEVSSYKAAEQEFLVNAYALVTVVDFISSLMSRVEYQTFYRGQFIQGGEWYRLNVRPNLNQNAAQFWKEFWSKLLYYQEVLVVEVGDQLILADDFVHHPEYALREDRFEQVSRGDMTFRGSFAASEVLYLQYSSQDVTAVIQSVLGLYSNLISQAAQAHAQNGGERGILNISSAAAGPEDFEKKYGEWIFKRFKSYFSSKNAVMPLFKGMTYTGRTMEIQGAGEDVERLFKGALSRSAQAYKLPPAIFLGEVAGMGDVIDLMLTACIDPLAGMAEAELTGKQFDRAEFAAGSRIAAFTNNIKHTDLFDVAASFDKLFADGFSYNDLMRLLHMPQVDEPWANAHHVTKNYDTMQMLEGGETK